MKNGQPIKVNYISTTLKKIIDKYITSELENILFYVVLVFWTSFGQVGIFLAKI